MEQSPRKEFPKESIEGNIHTSRYNIYEFDVYKLIDLTKEIPETEIKTEEYLNELEKLCWRDQNNTKVTAKEVADIYKEQGLEKAIIDRPEFGKHLEKIDKADYSHPILLLEGRIVDGMHRFAKAYSNGITSIKARIITQIPEAAIIKIHREKELSD